MGVLDSSPEDEVEGEIVYFQHRLLRNAVARKQFTGLFLDLLISRVFYFLILFINSSIFSWSSPKGGWGISFFFPLTYN